MGSLQERVVSLISQPPAARASRDIEMVLPWLQKRSQLLMELDRDTLKDIMRHCSYEKATTDDIIIKQGDRGDKFYVIMTGRASVHIVTKSDVEDGGDRETSGSNSEDAGDRHAKGGSQQVSANQSPRDRKEDKELQELDRSLFGKFIMHFEAGTSFGEIALMSDDAIRNASILADTDMDLLVIDRALFNRSVKAKEEAAYKERNDFVQTHPLFAGWNAKLRRLLEMSLKKEIHPFGSVIVRQGQPAFGLVFILSGQARICMEPGRHELQYPTLMRPPPDPLTTANKKPPVRDRARTPKARKTHAQIEVRRHQGYAAAEKRLKGRTVDLCCVERNEIVGDTEMSLELDTNLSTIVSTATTEIFVLNAKNYERLVSKKNPNTVRQMLAGVCQKVELRMQSAKASQLPVLPHLLRAATALQRRIGGTSEDHHHHKVHKGDKPKQRETGVEKSLARMFLKGQVPLIKPCLPDSLFYREASAAKMKTLMNSPYAKLRSLNMLSTYTALRRKAPRSIQQLKGNVKAERELLGQPQPVMTDRMVQDYQDYYRHEHDDDYDDDEDTTLIRRTLPRRPASATPGFQQARVTVRPFASARPRSAMDMHIVPCQAAEASPWGSFGAGAGGATEDEGDENTLDKHTVSEIFHHMDAVQRDKSESRMRVLCTNTARSELRTKLETEPDWSETNNHSQDYPELYEDAFYDWETSDGNLRDLESRIKSFCTYVTSNSLERRPSSSKSRPAVTQMKRFEVEDSNVPLPGGTVFVHQKPCRYTPIATRTNHSPAVVSSSASASPHLHIRRFMLQRDKQPKIFSGS